MHSSNYFRLQYQGPFDLTAAQARSVMFNPPCPSIPGRLQKCPVLTYKQGLEGRIHVVLHLKLCTEPVQELLPNFEESHGFVGRL